MSEEFEVHLLVVDDDEVLTENLMDYYAKKGATVYRAHNGQEALEVLKENKVNVVLTDYFMPLMNGEEFYDTLCKTTPEADKPEVIFFSGEAEEIRTRLMDKGIGFVLDKPIDRGKVWELIITLV